MYPSILSISRHSYPPTIISYRQSSWGDRETIGVLNCYHWGLARVPIAEEAMQNKKLTLHTHGIFIFFFLLYLLALIFTALVLLALFLPLPACILFLLQVHSYFLLIITKRIRTFHTRETKKLWSESAVRGERKYFEKKIITNELKTKLWRTIEGDRWKLRTTAHLEQYKRKWDDNDTGSRWRS